MDNCSGWHICAFFNSREEECQVLAPYYQAALDRRELNLHLVHPDDVPAHGERLRAAGFDPTPAECGGDFAIQGWQPVDPDSRAFNGARWLDAFDQLDTAARNGRHTGLRVMAHMTHALQTAADPADLMAYEAELNERLMHRDHPVVCVYDLAALDGAAMMDLLRTHPYAVIDGTLRENPFFTPPPEMLRELSARRGTGFAPGLLALR